MHSVAPRRLCSRRSSCCLICRRRHTRYFRRNTCGTTKYPRPRGQSLLEINVSTTTTTTTTTMTTRACYLLTYIPLKYAPLSVIMQFRACQRLTFSQNHIFLSRIHPQEISPSCNRTALPSWNIVQNVLILINKNRVMIYVNRNATLTIFST